jgi:hypothetical protein
MKAMLIVCSIVLTVASLSQYFAGDLLHAILFGVWNVSALVALLREERGKP